MTTLGFRKMSLMATSVISALGYAGASRAISQAEPGEALLVPYVLFDSANAVNTLIGLTVPYPGR
jgi:hypothetical protein